ncbi:MAG: hypothetical protein NWR72_20150 [Bacteroidia bacterium]|nr:hypothetical protein [Bacteroidia bacterium]
MQIDNIHRVHIQWEEEESTILSILLTASGQVNRMGDGTGDPASAGVFMGTTEEPLFEEWISLLDEELMEMAGRYEFPDPMGTKCKLTIALEGNDESTGFEFVYGIDSLGPPEEIMELVHAAVDLTESWWDSKRFKRKRS